jgi:hypothetical protein
MSVLFVSAHTSTPSAYQTVLTNADRKEILSVLFERELAASQNENPLIVRLAPGTDSNWLVELPGIRFQKLTYDEVKQVSEYYELRDVKIRRDFVDVWLSKGNYCKKAGTTYQFRREDGKWKVKTPRYSESVTGLGTACVGCKTGSGAVYGWKKETAPAAKPTESKPQDLVLTGKARAIRCRRSDTKYIRCEVDLSLDFSNRGNHPIIILQPHEDYTFWLGARSLALAKAGTEDYNRVYGSAGWPSFYDTEKYRLLGEALDQATPPPQLTRAIPPGESWTWLTTIQLALGEENTCSGSVGVEIGWKELKKLTAPVWLEVSYEMWPFNVEIHKPDLGGQLRNRWKKYGNLYLEEKSNRYWFAHLTSEPIELDFQSVTLHE